LRPKFHDFLPLQTSRPESNDRAADSTSVFDSLAEAVAGNDQVSPEPQTFVKFMQDEELLQGDDDHEIHPEDDDDVSVQWISEDEERRAIEAGFQYIDVENEHYKDNYDERKASPSGRKPLPVEVRCFDTARIYVKGGDGGRGCVAFRREKYVPRGGPSGGNGGLGGSVWLEADISLNSLLSFRRKIHFRADPGSPGQGSDMHGGAGKDMVIKVPPGTIARLKGAASSEEDSILAEVLKPGHRVMLAAGGRGGRGNQSFKTSRNTAPTMAELGEKGQGMHDDILLKSQANNNQQQRRRFFGHMPSAAFFLLRFLIISFRKLLIVGLFGLLPILEGFRCFCPYSSFPVGK